MSYRDDVAADLTARSAAAKAVGAYLRGDHWQNGEGFSAEFLRRQAQGLAARYGQEVSAEYLGGLRENLDKLFNPAPQLRECVYRHVDGVLGEEPLWYYLDGKDKDTAVTASVETWWNNKLVLEELREAAATLLYATTPQGRTSSVMRYFLSGSPESNLESVLDNLEPMHVPPDMGGVLYDGRNQPLLGYYHYSKDQHQFTEYSALWQSVPPETRMGVIAALRSRLDRGRAPNTIYVPADDLTVVWLEDEASVISASLYNLQGDLTIFDLRRRPLVTDANVRNQRNMDTTATMITAADASGVPTYFGINFQPPGWFEDANGNKSPIGTTTHTKWVGVAAKSGHKDINLWTGLPEQRVGADGSKQIGYANASIQRFDIIDSAPLLASLEAQRALFYEAMKQGHLVDTISASSSGDALKQRTNDFAASLNTTASIIGYGMMTFLRLPLRFAAHFGVKGLENLEPYTKCRVTAVQLTPAEREAIMSEVERGFLPREDGLAKLGIEDTSQALATIRLEHPELFAPTPPTPPSEPVAVA